MSVERYIKRPEGSGIGVGVGLDGREVRACP